MAPPPEQPILKHPPAQWDPFRNYEFDKAPLSSTAIFRVKKDLMLLFTEPPPGLFVTPDESDMMIIHAIIIGTVETPYEGGFFYFVIRCPPDYPIRPPLVKFMTTNAGTVRFNPNLYKNGKVCLSILGTWEGPAWSPAQQISSLLLSIQSLLTEKPYHNEPGFEQERYPGDVQRYSEIIKHETLRVAVCGMLENECCLHIPPSLRQIMEQTFLQYYDHYITVAKENLSMDGMKMLDPFREERGYFRYRYTLKRLEALHATLSAKYGSVENLSPSEKCDSDTISSETKVNNTAEESEETNCEAASNCEADDSSEATGICEASVECKVDSNATEDCKSSDCKSTIETKTPTQSDTVQSSS